MVAPLGVGCLGLPCLALSVSLSGGDEKTGILLPLFKDSPCGALEPRTTCLRTRVPTQDAHVQTHEGTPARRHSQTPRT